MTLVTPSQATGSSVGPGSSGAITVGATSMLFGWQNGTNFASDPLADWADRAGVNLVIEDRLNPGAGAYAFAPNWAGGTQAQSWVSQVIGFNLVVPGASVTLTATSLAVTPTLYPANLTVAGTTVLTAATRAFTPTLYPVILTVQTVTFSTLVPIRVLQFKSGEVAKIVVRATVPQAERSYYADVTKTSQHPAAGAAETAALRTGELVEILVSLPNPKAITTYAQLQTRAEAEQTAFQNRINQAVYGTMDGLEGMLTTFDGTTWS